MNNNAESSPLSTKQNRKPRLWLFFLAVIIAAVISLSNYAWIKSLKNKDELQKNIARVQNELNKTAEEIKVFREKEGIYPRINQWVTQMAEARRSQKGLLPGQKEALRPDELGIEFTFDPFKKIQDHYEYGVKATRNLEQTDGPFIVSSYGPDGDNDIIDLKITGATPNYGQSEPVLNYAYDPTNGLYSSGDIFILSGLPENQMITSFQLKPLKVQDKQ